eukprot:TRINITY_DN4672_c0_g1_i2.p1 TRINITY_DN4672_c0_g1~~TRINITY_DN4672_c0_g1_i2.p1  ORF type:complete len:1571 (+),score=391.98 TRINITY_DN4672_c0_g1_i2:471-4715(+)
MSREVYALLQSADYEQVLAGNAKDVLGKLPWNVRAMSNMVLYNAVVVLYACSLACAEILYYGVNSGSMNAASMLLLTDAGIVNFSLILRVGELLILTTSIIYKLWDVSVEREMQDLSRLSVLANDDITGWTFTALQLLQDGKLHPLAAHLTQLREQDTHQRNHRVLFFAGVVSHAQGDNTAALQHYRGAVELQPQWSACWLVQGLAQADMGALTEAHLSLQRARDLAPRNAYVQSALGSVLHLQQRYAEALKAYSQALKLDPNAVKVWIKLSRMLAEMKNYGEAQHAAERAVALNPHDVASQLQLAVIYRRNGQPAQYSAMCEHLEKSNSLDSIALEQVADVRAREDRDLEAACVIYSCCVRLNPSSRRTVKKYAKCLAQCGRRQEAVDVVENYFATEPDLSQQQEFELRWLLALWYTDSDAERALQQLQYIAYYQPYYDDKMLVSQGKRFLTLGRLHEARDVLHEAMTTLPADTDVQFYLALTLALLGESDDMYNAWFEKSVAGGRFSKYRLGLWMFAQKLNDALTPEWLAETLDYLRFKHVPLLDTYAALASAYHALGETRQALRFYEEALKLERDPVLLHDFACLLLSIDAFKYAEKALKLCLQQQKDPYAFCNLIFSLRQQQREQDATELYATLKRRFPDVETPFESIDGVAFGSESLFYQLYRGFLHLRDVQDKFNQMRHTQAYIDMEANRKAAMSVHMNEINISPNSSPRIGRSRSMRRPSAAAAIETVADAVDSDEDDGIVPAQAPRTRTRRTDRLRSAVTLENVIVPSTSAGSSPRSHSKPIRSSTVAAVHPASAADSMQTEQIFHTVTASDPKALAVEPVLTVPVSPRVQVHVEPSAEMVEQYPTLARPKAPGRRVTDSPRGSADFTPVVAGAPPSPVLLPAAASAAPTISTVRTTAPSSASSQIGDSARAVPGKFAPTKAFGANKAQPIVTAAPLGSENKPPAAPVAVKAPVIDIKATPGQSATTGTTAPSAPARRGGPPLPPPGPAETMLNKDGKAIPKPPDMGAIAARAGGGPPPPPDIAEFNLFGSSRNLLTPSTPSRRMKQFHWNKVPLHKLQESFWSSSDVGATQVNIDASELEDLFIAQESKRKIEAESESTVKTLLDQRRANNVAIALSKIGMSYAEIRNAIAKVDTDSLTADNLTNMLKVCPTNEELELIRSYKGDISRLTEADQFFAAISDLPNLRVRLESFVFRSSFDQQLHYLREQLSVIIAACQELKDSTRFTRLLEVILQLGNTLNQSGHAGNARGFKLDSLLKMADMKQTNRNTTLLHYLVQLLHTKMPELLSFPDDLAHMPRAVRTSTVAIRTDIQALRAQCQTLNEELKRVAPDDLFAIKMGEFAAMAETEIAAVEALFATAMEQFASAAKYYAEDPEQTKPEAFFEMLHNFIVSFKGVYRASLQRKA